MSERRIAAEVVPAVVSDAGPVAKELARHGLRVLRVDSSISVDATPEQWEAALHVTFSATTRTRQAELGQQVTFLRADPGSVELPAALRGRVADVAFVEPPELY